MFIFSDDGREAFLKLVSRLSGQALLLMPCFFLPTLPKFTWSEPLAWILMAWFGLLYLFAFGASMVEFFDAAKKSEGLRKITQEVSATGATGWTHVWLVVTRSPRKEIVNFVTLLFILQGCSMAVLFFLVFSLAQKS
ncbi:hypothetical protein [Rhodocyclus tenuis]|uniref:hypothetical protein n=1 Tax=Rhodocyclus tenuis TaxID=1066 RepID=UPI001904A8D1|nr:hypothetical protein [Rhodocyclus tenuis]MBK1680409.1 hypothetical protein [Rhodocyclus tenuis]